MLTLQNAMLLKNKKKNYHETIHDGATNMTETI